MTAPSNGRTAVTVHLLTADACADSVTYTLQQGGNREQCLVTDKALPAGALCNAQIVQAILHVHGYRPYVELSLAGPYWRAIAQTYNIRNLCRAALEGDLGRMNEIIHQAMEESRQGC